MSKNIILLMDRSYIQSYEGIKSLYLIDCFYLKNARWYNLAFFDLYIQRQLSIFITFLFSFFNDIILMDMPYQQR